MTGKVTDETGKPIAGALVRTKFLNDIREATTGPDGVYTLVGCEPQPDQIVVSAQGRATDMKELNIEPGMGPVDFAMKPGGTVRIRVLDEQGKPVPKPASSSSAGEAASSTSSSTTLTNTPTRMESGSGTRRPLDEFQADICPPGGMQLIDSR